jgi:hypothetical protein
MTIEQTIGAGAIVILFILVIINSWIAVLASKDVVDDSEGSAYRNLVATNNIFSMLALGCGLFVATRGNGMLTEGSVVMVAGVLGSLTTAGFVYKNNKGYMKWMTIISAVFSGIAGILLGIKVAFPAKTREVSERVGQRASDFGSDVRAGFQGFRGNREQRDLRQRAVADRGETGMDYPIKLNDV